MRAVLLLALLLALSGCASPAVRDTQDPQTLAFVGVHGCEITRRLQAIHASTAPRDRFVIVARRDMRQAYVQCLFQDRDQRMLCEAASGWWYDRPGEPRRFRVEAGGRAALERLGFDTSVRTGNYQRWIATPTPAAFEAVAVLMLSALREGYTTPPGTPLEFTAPLAPDTPACSGRGS